MPGLGMLFDSLKGAASTLREADKIPQYQAVLDAYQQISEMQRTIYDLEEKLRESDKELKAIREAQASTEESTTWRHLLWLKDDQRPRCLHCWEKKSASSALWCALWTTL